MQVVLHNRFLWWQGSAVKWTQIDVCLFSFHTLLCTHTCTDTQTETGVLYKRNLPYITKPLHNRFLSSCHIISSFMTVLDPCVSWDIQVSRLIHLAIFPPQLINNQTETFVNVNKKVWFDWVFCVCKLKPLVMWLLEFAIWLFSI